MTRTRAPQIPVQAANVPEQPRAPQGQAPVALVRDAIATGGEPLSPPAQQGYSRRFGHDFSHIRIHSDERAARSAGAVGARAYNLGRHIVFGPGEYTTASPEGRRLLAHELAHAIQRDGDTGVFSTPVIGARDSAAELAAERAAEHFMGADLAPPFITATGFAPANLLLRAPTTGTKTTTGVVTPADVLAYLRELAAFMRGQRDFVNVLLQEAQVDPPARAQAERQRAARMLTQQIIQGQIADANRTFGSVYSTLPANDAQRTSLRAALESILSEARLNADVALGLTNANAAAQAAGQADFVETLAEIVEASPMTSAGLAATTQFTAADEAQATQYRQDLEALLDDMLVRLPGLQLTAAQQNQFFSRLQIALRRAFTTISTGPGGTIDVRGISDAQIVTKYQSVTALLSQGMPNAPQVQIINDRMAAYQLPDPVPDVTQQLAPRTADLAHVPADEAASVRYGILQAANTIFAAGSTVQLQDAIWPLVLPIRHGANVVSVRYELVFDSSGNVRAERLGPAQPREVPATFAQLSIPDKKAALISQFGLAGVDDRPASGSRTAANWTDDELNQLKAAYDLIPPSQRAGLGGVTIVRDHVSPAPQAAQSFQYGVFHSGASPTYDTPAGPSHAPPHIHYFDEAFNNNNFGVSSAAGVGGPGADFDLLHEVGHAEGDLPVREANVAITTSNAALNGAITALNAARRGVRLPAAQNAIVRTWIARMQSANSAIHSFNTAVVGTTPSPTPIATLLQTAQTALASEQTARAALDASAVPQGIITAADAVSDALPPTLASSQQLQTAGQQNSIFISLATRFGFFRFTDYANRGGANDWFAETYALYVTDPNRLNQMNRRMFLWFQAGMPLDANWNP